MRPLLGIGKAWPRPIARLAMMMPQRGTGVLRADHTAPITDSRAPRAAGWSTALRAADPRRGGSMGSSIVSYHGRLGQARAMLPPCRRVARYFITKKFCCLRPRRLRRISRIASSNLVNVSLMRSTSSLRKPASSSSAWITLLTYVSNFLSDD